MEEILGEVGGPLAEANLLVTGDAGLQYTAGALSACVSVVRESAGGEGHPEVVKRCGGQLGVLRGGTGGKEESDTGETELERLSTAALERNLVLSFGTGFTLSPSTPPFPSSSLPPLCVVCVWTITGFFSPAPPPSPGTLDSCLCLGTGFSLVFTDEVSPSFLSLS